MTEVKKPEGKKCPHCGKLLKSGDSFCHHCLTELDIEDIEREVRHF